METLTELWWFFRKKLRKGNGVRWAVAYTYDRWQWTRTDPTWKAQTSRTDKYR